MFALIICFHDFHLYRLGYFLSLMQPLRLKPFFSRPSWLTEDLFLREVEIILIRKKVILSTENMNKVKITKNRKKNLYKAE